MSPRSMPGPTGRAPRALSVGDVTRHFQNRAGGWEPAMLDIAQDHLLCHLHDSGLFELGLVFKGGTALRKLRAGVKGRFSTDLDFAAPDEGLVALVLETIDGHACHGFRFALDDADVAGGRAKLVCEAPLTRAPPHGPGRINVAAKVELAPRSPWLDLEHLPMLASPTHAALGHPLVTLPVMAVAEAIAEKLARYARVPLARDLYDLCWYGRSVIEEPLVRRLWLQKVYGDVVVDERWGRPFDPAAILEPRQAGTIDDESIGFLIHPADIVGWEREFRSRYAFLGRLDDEDLRWARCDPRDRYHFEQLAG